MEQHWKHFPRLGSESVPLMWLIATLLSGSMSSLKVLSYWHSSLKDSTIPEVAKNQGRNQESCQRGIKVFFPKTHLDYEQKGHPLLHTARHSVLGRWLMWQFRQEAIWSLGNRTHEQLADCSSFLLKCPFCTLTPYHSILPILQSLAQVLLPAGSHPGWCSWVIFLFPLHSYDLSSSNLCSIFIKPRSV